MRQPKTYAPLEENTPVASISVQLWSTMSHGGVPDKVFKPFIFYVFFFFFSSLKMIGNTAYKLVCSFARFVHLFSPRWGHVILVAPTSSNESAHSAASSLLIPCSFAVLSLWLTWLSSSSRCAKDALSFSNTCSPYNSKRIYFVVRKSLIFYARSGEWPNKLMIKSCIE